MIQPHHGSASSNSTCEGNGVHRRGRVRFHPLRNLRCGGHTVRLRVDGQTFDKPIVVREDPRIDILPLDRTAGSDAQTAAGELYKRALAVNGALAKAPASPTLAENKRLARELVSHLSQLYNDLDRWVGKPTADQLSRLAKYKSVVESLEK